MIKNKKLKKNIKIIFVTFTMTFYFLIILIPILKSMSLNNIDSERLVFLSILLFSLFLPSGIFCIVTMRAKQIEYIIIPGVFLLTIEYYFFHNFSTWIASNANAAIGILFIPFYLFITLIISYVIAFAVTKVRKNIINKY
jgi:hypothetical protein